MLTLRKSNIWHKIEKDWESIYNQMKGASPFQSPEVMKICYINFWPYYFVRKEIPEFIIVYDDDQPVFGLALTRKILSKEATLWGKDTGYNSCSPIWMSVNYIRPCMQLVLKEYDIIIMQKVHPENPILSEVNALNLKDYDAVKIDISIPYEDYYNSLTKSSRQNLRTAYNRMKTDNQDLEFRVLHSDEYKQNLSTIINLSESRHAERYGHKKTFLGKIFRMYLNYATLIYKNSSKYSLSFMIMINGEIAGVMSGLISSNSYIVPRLAINNRFKRYSPGIIMLNETIKWLQDNCNIKYLDLSFGLEPYKFNMGGTKYSCKNFAISMKKNDI